MENADHKKIVLKAIYYMKKHLDQDLTTQSMAKHVGYSHYHFVRIFKKVTGISPRHFLSALRIEESKQKLIKSDSLILNSLLQVGYRSVGTFSSKFKTYVGLSPKKFKSKSEHLAHIMEDYNEEEHLPFNNENKPAITCYIQAPNDFKGLIFVGLFPRPIPDQKPISGTALHRRRFFTFSNIPHGTYYILAASIKWSMNPKDYYLLGNSLRGKAESPVIVENNTYQTVEIKLREPSPLDPPILINLPNLLLDKRANKKNF